MTSSILSQIEAVIFDFDGVLVDSEPISLGELHKSFKTCGINLSYEEMISQFLGASIADTSAYMKKATGRDPGEEFPDRWQQRVLDDFKRDLPMIPGAEALLDRLDANGISYCLASGSSVRRLAFAVGLIGHAERFKDRAFSTELVRHGKPAPDIFEYSATRLGVAPEKCMVLEDGTAGVRGAREAGIGTIVGFVGGSHLSDPILRAAHAEKLRECGAGIVIERLEDLFD